LVISDTGVKKMRDIMSKIVYAINSYWEAQQSIRRQFDDNKIRRIQTRRLQYLLQYSVKNIKYYQELFQHNGLNVDKIKTPQDLQHVPFLTKVQLRDRFWDFLPRSLPACRVSRTSGSLGIPVCIFSDWKSRRMNSAAAVRFRKAIGIPLFRRPMIILLNTDHDQDRPPHWTYIQGIHKTYYLNPYITSAQNIAYINQVRAKLSKPVISGNASAVRTLAHYTKDGIFPYLSPSVIITGGEVLFPQARDLIESTFGIGVIDVYACNEARDIAWQCRQYYGYHINSDNVIVEIVKGDEPVGVGETGEVVITDLNRYIMPIIRYKNGDMARFTDEICPCGCKLPMIAEITGRTGDNIHLPNGNVILWNHLKSQMTHPHIRQFQLVQEVDGSFMIRYIPGDGADTEQLDALLLNRYRNLLGDSIKIKIEKTAIIHPDASGKSKLVVSHFRPDS
jgi:phenylacetate-CoA ligase